MVSTPLKNSHSNTKYSPRTPTSKNAIDPCSIYFIFQSIYHDESLSCLSLVKYCVLVKYCMTYCKVDYIKKNKMKCFIFSHLGKYRLLVTPRRQFICLASLGFVISVNKSQKSLFIVLKFINIIV